MKTVFQNSDQVFHLFAQRIQDEARSSNVFFTGKDMIYSYGYHYLLGEFIEHKNDTIMILNDSGYSSTTSKHIYKLRRAVFQKIYNLTEIAPARVLRELKSLKTSLIKANKPELYISKAVNLIQVFNEFQKFIKGYKPKYNGFMSDSYNGFDNKEAIKEIRQISAFFNPQNFADQLAKAKEQQRKKEKEIREIGGKLHKEYIQLWINHSDKDYYDSLSSKNQKLFFDYKKKHSEDYIRISGDEIETTKNVKVSIQDAAILYRMIKAGKDIKGYKIGYYTVISLNGVLHIGCHKINRENMTEIGEQLIK